MGGGGVHARAFNTTHEHVGLAQAWQRQGLAMEILVMGGTRFVGRPLVARLQAGGCAAGECCS